MKRLFDVLRQSEEPYITQADLKQLLSGVLLSHPGLEFLQETPEFQERSPIPRLSSVDWPVVPQP